MSPKKLPPKAATKRPAKKPAARPKPVTVPLTKVGVSDTAARVGRTGLQGSAAALILEGVEAFNLAHPTARQTAWLLVVLTPLIGWLQGQVENRLGKAILRSVPPKDEPVPVVDDTGLSAVGLLIVVVLILAVFGPLGLFVTKWLLIVGFIALLLAAFAFDRDRG